MGIHSFFETFPPTTHSLLLLFVHSFETSYTMKSSILAVLGGASTALAAVRGFNYASQGQSYDGFASQFKTAASLAGADDFTSARLYTMIQEGTTNTPIDAIQAAIDTNTTLLLGLGGSVQLRQRNHGPQECHLTVRLLLRRVGCWYLRRERGSLPYLGNWYRCRQRCRSVS